MRGCKAGDTQNDNVGIYNVKLSSMVKSTFTLRAFIINVVKALHEQGKMLGLPPKYASSRHNYYHGYSVQDRHHVR
jgi:hypothetical protein